jgi:hypothetical protein
MGEETMAHKGNHSGRALFSLGLGYLVDQDESQSMGLLSPVIQSIWRVNFSMLGLMDGLRFYISN